MTTTQEPKRSFFLALAELSALLSAGGLALFLIGA